MTQKKTVDDIVQCCIDAGHRIDKIADRKRTLKAVSGFSIEGLASETKAVCNYADEVYLTTYQITDHKYGVILSTEIPEIDFVTDKPINRKETFIAQGIGFVGVEYEGRNSYKNVDGIVKDFLEERWMDKPELEEPEKPNLVWTNRYREGEGDVRIYRLK